MTHLKNLSRLTRAAMMLLVMLLTATTAWAGDVNYFDPTAAVGQQTKQAANPTAISGNTTTLGTADTETWYYVSGNVTCENRIEVKGTVNIILVDGSNFTAQKGIHLPSGNTLNIWAQKAGEGCGILTAYNYEENNYEYNYHAAIGGNGGKHSDNLNVKADDGEDAGNLNIYGGNIYADGNVGGGYGGNGKYEYYENFETEEWWERQGPGGDGGVGGMISFYGGIVRITEEIGDGTAGRSGSGEPEGWGSRRNGSGQDGSRGITLRWTSATDEFYAWGYNGTVTLVNDFMNKEDNTQKFKAGNYSDGQLNWKTLVPSGVLYDITIGGSYDPVCLIANRAQAVEDTPVTLTAVNGYTVSSVTVTKVGGGTVSVTDNHDGTWSFTMPAQNVTVTPVATRTHYEISLDVNQVTLDVADADKLVQDNVTYYRLGATIRFTLIPPDATCVFDDLIVATSDGGVDYSESNGTYTFTMPVKDVAITPRWEKIAFRIDKQDNISVSTDAANIISVDNDDYYKTGATITVTPPEGEMFTAFSVKELYGDDVVNSTDNGDGTYSFTMPAYDVEISATCAFDTRGMTLLEGTAAFTVTEGISGSEYTYHGSDDKEEGCTRLLDGKYSSTDTNNYSKWCVDGFSWGGDFYYNEKTCYVEFNTTEPVIPKKYVLITGNDNASYKGRNPKDWKVLAKVNVSDTDWDVIASVTNDETLQDVNCTPYTFDFNNPTNKAYQYFRFEIYATRDYWDEETKWYFPCPIMQLSEMQMWVRNNQAITMNASGIMTYASDKALDFTGIDGLTAYIVSDFDGTAGTLTLTPVGKVSAGTGLLLKGTASTTFRVPVAVSATAPTQNYLVGVTDANTEVNLTEVRDNVNYTNFILANGKYGIDWYTLSSAGAIGANKAYLSLPTSSLSSSSRFTWVYENGETGIADANENETLRYENENFYDLQGRRVAQPTKGLYIHNGKKIVIK